MAKRRASTGGRRGAPRASNPNPERGRPSTGRIAAITRGRGDGYIRARGERFYFALRDVLHQSFNDLEVGDGVAFEAIEDNVSGHRAVRVEKQK
jgi:hypothetical protein